MSFSNQNIEICTVKIFTADDPIFILGVYRPIHGTIDSFCEEIEGLLQNSMLRNKRCIFTGDMNINLLQQNAITSNFVETLQSHHFFPTISIPTRYPPNVNSNIQPSLLDQIWVNSLNIYNSNVISYDITDHCPITLQLPIPTSNIPDKNELVKITFRVNNEVNRERFRQLIMDFDWNGMNPQDINSRTENFTRKLDSLYCSSFPLQTKFIPKRKAMNPWFTPELSELVRRKNLYFDLCRIGAVSKQENNSFKNRFKSIVHKAKTSYYRNLFDRNFGNMRAIWATLNSLMERKSKSQSIDCIINK